ncbi:hypothetical protein AMS68_007419 [Peltaster fructicola]|uniref:Uncharacterized protein n=1 Tax=Peltaster fructicola TaxID=286661 RepID=A0A6H0Y4F0_9PEZI|nr:hypothetical protein AMS68_007419 [Peltaster fructicola]
MRLLLLPVKQRPVRGKDRSLPIVQGSQRYGADHRDQRYRTVVDIAWSSARQSRLWDMDSALHPSDSRSSAATQTLFLL